MTPPRTATVVAYGSLMSGLGLASLAPLSVEDACRVRVAGCRRGFGKLSQYGDRFAMVLEPTVSSAPIRAHAITGATPVDASGIDALALTLRVPDVARIAQREGYRADAMLALAHAAEKRGEAVATYLWRLAEGVGHDVAAYRRALAAVVGYASPHYVPHPVAVADDVPAIAFLPPGAEGTGRDEVVSIRVQTAETGVFTLREAWRLKPNASQLEYAAMCCLAEVHNLSLADVLGDLAAYPPLARAFQERLATEVAAEPARFRGALGLDATRYAERFPATPRRAAFVADHRSANDGR